MKLASFLLKSRGPVNLAKRIPTIARRFGITNTKIDRCLHGFVDVALEFDAKPTLAITANLLDRYPGLVQRLRNRGVEFAIHGLVHTDYSELSLGEHLDHISRAMRVFDRHEIDFVGFRCPYLRSNSYTLEAVRKLGFIWESSDVIAWDVIDPGALDINPRIAYKKLLSLYSARSSITNFSAPKLLNGIVEIPVSIPDDEAIIDRLGLDNTAEITRLWLSILDSSYRRGDIFTVQLHHERVPFLAPALRSVLQEASMLSPSVWLANLGEIADWYMRRDTFRFEVIDVDQGRYDIKVHADPDATVLLKNIDTHHLIDKWYSNYQVIRDRRFTISAAKRPVIGISKNFNPAMAEFLRGEGFIVEQVDNPESCALYLAADDDTDEVSLIDRIEGSVAPLLRFWRWPRSARSAVSITGDIDSITLLDFARRIFEV
ncbi:MAG: polysaccharide deacetylase family protein [Actinobacteria bacterium]|nr:polysaccharide deacetylase family protein [Actinomycetota bacterium]